MTRVLAIGPLEAYPARCEVTLPTSYPTRGTATPSSDPGLHNPVGVTAGGRGAVLTSEPRSSSNQGADGTDPGGADTRDLRVSHRSHQGGDGDVLAYALRDTHRFNSEPLPGGSRERAMGPMIDPDAAARVFNTMRKLFTAQTFTIEQEKRLKAVLRGAYSEDVATDAVGRVYADGVVYPVPRHIREALAVEHQRIQPELEEPSGPFITFADWYAVQDADMQARVRRVFPSLKIEPPGTAARAIHGGTDG